MQLVKNHQPNFPKKTTFITHSKPHKMSQLVVYRASAGSGKTFRLAAEYIKQIITKPDSFKNILAVTFTNKATAEMKGRILSELFAISKGEETPMSKEISKDLNLHNDTIQPKAQRALSLILHDYSRFSISTIDSFVQRVIQALLWEIGEQGGIDIELDTDPVLEHAADNLLDSASKIDELLHWLTSMGNSLIDEGQSWDVRRKLMELGKQLFSEKFRLMDSEEVKKFTDKKRVNQLKESLQKLSLSIIAEVKELANSAYNELDKRGIAPSDFSHGNSGVMGYFNKCASIDETAVELPIADGARVQSALGDPSGESWVNKTTFNNKLLFAPIESAVIEVLHPTLSSLVSLVEKHNAHYISAKLILKNLENLALIGDLWNKVRELSREEGFLLLSDSGHLLKEFVKESDAPFVYEKVGTRYDVFMIDEFQDTSEVQWHNFKPLIENSLSQDYFSMIVGDVKQSIYRWRNGDWSILASGVEKDFIHWGIDERFLNINRRSLPSIIDFNNSFFEMAKEKAIESIGENETGNSNIDFFKTQVEKAYKDVKQESPTPLPKQKGYVEVRFKQKANNTEYNELLSEELPQLINEARQNHGLSDIAILVRGKNDGQRIANILLEYNRNEKDKNQHITFVSQEGLQLKASAVVRLIISAFRLVQDPTNEIAKRILAKELAAMKEEENHSWHSYFKSSFTIEEVDWLSALNTRPLQEVFEAIANRYNLFAVSGELAHLAELHEHIATLSSKGGGDVNRFLNWWEQKGESLSLSVPESTNALSILTIHKSKGLQFPVVIIPYANWVFRPSSKQPLLWVETNEEPFNLLPKYPIHATSVASKSLFANDIMEESMKEMVDNLNMLYVAFTRPEKELYVFVPLTEKELNNDFDKVDSVSRLIRLIIPSMDSSKEKEAETFVFGELYSNPNEKKSTENRNNSWTMDNYPVGKTFRGIKLRMESEEFFLSSPSERLAPLQHGKVMHELFSNIFVNNDIDVAIQKLVVDGLIERSQQAEISIKIKEILNAEPFKDWFSGSWRIKNEASILTPEGHNYRPDRVMIKENDALVVDFKFGTELPSHLKQVARYMNLLNGMGYETTKGFVWYVDENRTIEVDNRIA